MQHQYNSDLPEQGVGIEVLLRRRGLHPTDMHHRIGDHRVIQWRGAFLPAERQTGVETFSATMSDTTNRQILRCIVSSKRPRTTTELRSICGDETKLTSLLAYLESGGIVVRDGASWSKGPQCMHIDNTGPTFEWAVAEWFRRELQAPAGHSVKLEEVRHGADLDVVAFVGDILVFVECKTGKPENISESDIRLFLQRTYDVKPEVAVLLVDTPDLLVEPARLVMQVYHELGSLERGTGTDGTLASDVRAPREVPGYKGLFWATRHVFVTGIPVSIGASLSQVLRFYNSYVRHQQYAQTVGVWDFEQGTVQKDSNEPFSVEGQIWIRF